MTISWIELPVPEELEVRQVYGFIFNTDGKILVLADGPTHNLPGGKPENAETFVQTLKREAMEESQALIGSTEYLGYQHIGGSEEFAQVRHAAMLDHLLPAAQDINTGREYIRLWVEPALVNGLLGWGQMGDRQVASAVRAATRVGSWGRT